MSITYTTNIPIGNQTPAQQRPSLEVNTNAVDTWTAVDHYGFNVANGGHHKQSAYVDQVSDATPVTGAVVEYGKTVSALIELFMIRPAGAAIQLSSGSPVIGAAFDGISLAAPGQTFLPGGLQLKWGTAVIVAGNTITVTYTVQGLTAFPSKGLTGWAIGYGTAGPYYITGAGITQTTITIGGPNGSNALWFALGA